MKLADLAGMLGKQVILVAEACNTVRLLSNTGRQAIILWLQFKLSKPLGSAGNLISLLLAQEKTVNVEGKLGKLSIPLLLQFK